MTKTLYYLPAARTDEQLEQMMQLEESGICVFCPQHFDEHHENPVEHGGTYWYVTKNDYPYKHTRAHLLIVPRKHITSVAELSSESWAEFGEIVAWAIDHYSLASQAVVIRSGDMRYNGGSVAHLHAHLVSGDPDDPDFEPVKFKVASKPKA
jgi:ATP adenylyltransferase